MKLKILFSVGILAISANTITPSGTAIAWQLKPYENIPQPKPYDWQSAQQHRDLMLQMQLDRWQREREQTSQDFIEQQERFERELRRLLRGLNQCE